MPQDYLIMKFKREDINVYAIGLFGLIIFRILIDICYRQLVSPIYKSTGMINHFQMTDYIYSWIILLLLSPFILVNYGKKNLSSNIILILSLISFIPTTSLMAFIPMPKKMLVLMSLYWMFLLGYNYFFPTVKMKIYTVKNNLFLWIILFLLCFTVVYISWRYTQFRFHFGLFDVYDIRLKAREFNVPTLLSYLNASANTILPIVLVYFLIEKKYVLSLAIALIILLNFGIEGQKSVLFMLFLAFLGYWFYKYDRLKYLIWGFILLCVLSLAEPYITNTRHLTTLFTNRLLYLPTLLHYHYYDFFSTHEFDYFKQGILRWFGATSSYEKEIPFIIGEKYWHNPLTRSNNGLFSDAYFNLGALGVMIFPIIIVLFLRVLDACAEGLSEKLVILPIASVVLALFSVTFSSALLTSGLLLLLLLLYSIPRKANINNEIPNNT